MEPDPLKSYPVSQAPEPLRPVSSNSLNPEAPSPAIPFLPPPLPEPED